jgi:hypothetical protein
MTLATDRQPGSRIPCCVASSYFALLLTLGGGLDAVARDRGRGFVDPLGLYGDCILPRIAVAHPDTSGWAAPAR